jgi:hypothetical protein
MLLRCSVHRKSESHRARLFLMRQANRPFCALAAFNFVSAERPGVRLAESDLLELKFDLCRGLDTVSSGQDRLCLACTPLNNALRDLRESQVCGGGGNPVPSWSDTPTLQQRRRFLYD